MFCVRVGLEEKEEGEKEDEEEFLHVKIPVCVVQTSC